MGFSYITNRSIKPSLSQCAFQARKNLGLYGLPKNEEHSKIQLLQKSNTFFYTLNCFNLNKTVLEES